MQLFTLVAGLAMATALWSGVQAINAEARASYGTAATTLGEGQFARLVPRNGQPFSQQVFVDLRRAGWRVSPVIEGRIEGVRIIGLDPLTAPNATLPVQSADGAEINAFQSNGGLIRAATDAAALLDRYGNVQSDPTLASMTAVADVGQVQTLLARPNQLDALIVDPVQPLRQRPLKDVAPMLVMQTSQGGSDVSQLTDSFHLNLTAFGLLSFAVGVFIVHGAIGLAFEQRRATVRTLRALGVPLRLLILVMAAELIGLAIIAGAIGVMLGYFIAAALLPDVAATLRGLYGAEVGDTLQLRPVWWLSGLAASLGGTTIAAVGSLWRLSKMPLLAGAQPRALALAAGGRAKSQGVIAAALLALALILAGTANGLMAGFVLLAALLIGAALALPIVLNVILILLQRLAHGVIAQWFWSDTRQQLPAISLALMALLLAMATNVGVSTMISSFRLTFQGFLDQRLASELYVAVDTPAQAAALIRAVEGRVDAVLPIQSADVWIADQPTEVYGGRDHSTYRDNWVFLESIDTPWDAVSDGSGILINEQLARRSELWVGDTAVVANKDFRVVGVFGDYGNPIGQALISEGEFAALFPRVNPRRFGLRTAPENVSDIKATILAQTDISDANIINQAGIKAISLGIFDRTFTVTAALNILTLSVAGFAILMSLLTLSAMRVPQLAPAWAMGLTRAQLGKLELWRTCLLAALTGLAALPLGLGLAWVLLAVVNVAAFGWRLPMYLFPADYAQLGILALLAAVLAALLPAIRLARTPPSVLLKVFSNER